MWGFCFLRNFIYLSGMKNLFSYINRKVNFDYFIIRTETAGIKLTGFEVKAIRAGKISLVDSYCTFEGEELFVRGLQITEAENGFYKVKNPVKKLLLKKQELRKLKKDLLKGLTIVPTKVFLSERGFIKVEIALVRGKKLYDQRDKMNEKETKKNLKNILKNQK